MLSFQVAQSQTYSSEYAIKYGVDVEPGAPQGLLVGQKAPFFSKQDVDGNLLNLETLLDEGPVVLTFYRGAWCPVCNRYMSEIKDSLPMITEKGATFLAVTPETEEGVEKFLHKTEAGITIISDRDESIMTHYDVLFQVTKKYTNKIKLGLQTSISKHNGQDEANLPVPATYVIGQDGVIKFVQFDYNYKNRASVASILTALEQL